MIFFLSSQANLDALYCENQRSYLVLELLKKVERIRDTFFNHRASRCNSPVDRSLRAAAAAT